MKSIPSAAILIAVLFACRSVAAQPDPGPDPMTAFRNGAFAEALTGWIRAATAGDGRAARYVGVLYDTGEGVAQDQAAALRWYRRGAGLGDVPAMFNVAVCLDAGRGTERDPAQAAYWYRQAAAHRFGRAEYNLALMQEQGDGVPRDRRAAASMFRAALRDGIQAAHLHLPAGVAKGTVTAGSGTPVEPTPPVATPDARKPAPAAVETPDATFVSAQRALLGRSPGAAAEAAALFARAAGKTGPAASMARYDLAWCYQNGIGVPADPQHAYRIFVQVAAETDDPVLGKLAQAAAERAARPPVMALDATRPAEPER